MGATHTTDPVTTFDKGIKRDPTLFPSLKDQKQWDLWWISTEAQAKAQNVHDVLKPKCKPSNDKEKALFIRQQQYVHAVAANTLLTDKGKSLVIGIILTTHS